MGAKRFITVLRLKGIDIEDIYVRGITKPLAKGEYLMGTYHQRFKRIRPWQQESPTKYDVLEPCTMHLGVGVSLWAAWTIRSLVSPAPTGLKPPSWE